MVNQLNFLCNHKDYLLNECLKSNSTPYASAPPEKDISMEFDWIALSICLAGFATLIALSAIDLKSWILPDKLNLCLGALGIAFHVRTQFQLETPQDLLYGALLGAGTLYVIRFFGNYYYKQDTLGLGDVKLLGAAGLWLGMEDVVMSLTIGAFAGLCHGILVAVSKAIKEKTKPNLHRLMIPAGPGFCIGIFVMCVWKIYPYFAGQ